MDNNYNFEVGDCVDGIHRESGLHLRGRVIEVLSGYRYLVESSEESPLCVPNGKQVIVSGNDLND